MTARVVYYLLKAKYLSRLYKSLACLPLFYSDCFSIMDRNQNRGII